MSDKVIRVRPKLTQAELRAASEKRQLVIDNIDMAIREHERLSAK